MHTNEFEIIPYEARLRQQMLMVWERSVMATHSFLTEEDFADIRLQVHSIDFEQFQVYCLLKKDFMAGFIGVADKKIEMLFLDPDYIGMGLGKQLLNFAVTQLSADKLDVNEQNEKALWFYKKSGFEVYERTEKDDAGRSYPLLRMKRK